MYQDEDVFIVICAAVEEPRVVTVKTLPPSLTHHRASKFDSAA